MHCFLDHHLRVASRSSLCKLEQIILELEFLLISVKALCKVHSVVRERDKYKVDGG